MGKIGIYKIGSTTSAPYGRAPLSATPTFFDFFPPPPHGKLEGASSQCSPAQLLMHVQLQRWSNQ